MLCISLRAITYKFDPAQGKDPHVALAVMGLLPRLTPWFSWDEWMQVKNGLFSKDISQQIWSLEVVGMWRARNRIPHSVDSTAALIEVGIY